MTTVTNKNKSNNGEKHVCDFCGESPEEIWTGHKMEGQWCFNHFREQHEDKEAFDDWCRQFLNSSS